MRKIVRLLAIGFLVCAALAAVGLGWYWDLLLAEKDVLVSDSQANAYQVDPLRTLIVWKDQVFLLSRAEGIVVRPADYRAEFAGFLWWPRESYAGVIVGDGIKGDDRECFTFDSNGLVMQVNDRYGNGDGIEGKLVTIKVSFSAPVDKSKWKSSAARWSCERREPAAGS